ncbi:EAL domain-containing protein [Oricola nitratireducens]|uniref:EAL domain-containing protein n=1 Tax=Oricola nitratireducens TaxID=2775868 RepID=UPI0018666B9C|nr:EAL domain-containing protein [Oricola nitratireducens]
MIRIIDQRRTIVSAGILALILLAQVASLFGPLDRFLADKRFLFADRPASGEVVFVAIDKKSLDAVGVWPWPRSVHARITDRLHQLGAGEIYFDIDFSTPSDPTDDEAFAAAIERAQGSVTLPVFLQYPDAASTQRKATVTAPIDMLARNAWLATVNIHPNSDGKVRSFPTGQVAGSEFIPSVPAAIAGQNAGTEKAIRIDFGIDPATVPVVSVSDLLNDKADPGLFEGKKVVVGAYATELRDFYPVPKQGYIAGAMIQILAAETLIAGRDLLPVGGMPVAAVTLAFLILVLAGLRTRSPLGGAATLVAISAIAEALATFAYVRFGLLVPTAFIHVATLTALGLRSAAMSDFFRRLLREATREARHMRQVLQQVVSENFDAIVVIDEDGRALQTSNAAGAIFDLAPFDAQSDVPASSFLPEELCAEIETALSAVRDGMRHEPEMKTTQLPAEDGGTRSIEYTIGISVLDDDRKKKSGERRLVACLTARDITQRLSDQRKLQWLSDCDDMTNVWRRHAFLRIAGSTIRETGAGQGFAIVAINLHRFKTINIALGRETGNMVLGEVAQRLQDADARVRAVARLGGDTFAVLLDGIADEAAAHAAAECIVGVIKAPYRIKRATAQVGVKAGVVLHDPAIDAAETTGHLLERAEMALDEARIARGTEIVFFDETLANQRKRARIIERDLWGALDRDELTLHYQVQMGLKDGTPRGAEALIRWHHPLLGAVSPVEFVAIAEANGLITALGRWAMFTACKEAANWPEALSVSVNVAPQQLANDAIIADVKTALAHSGLDPARLTIELVESELLETDESTLARIRALKALGVSLSLDDFGTGYSGIAYLAQLPFDEIKLDKQFTRDLTTNPETQGILRSVTVLAETFKMTIVCEGVETREQETFLRLIGCQEGQGYLYSKPLDAADFRRLADELLQDGQRGLAASA